MTKKNQLKKEFIKFLKEHNAFVPFCVNLANPRWRGYIVIPPILNKKGMSLSQYLNKESCEFWLVTAFDWQDSNMWKELDYKWDKHVKQLQIFI